MWDDRLDQQLIQFRNQGFNYNEIALRMGVSRSAAIGRMQRLNGKVFPSDRTASRRKGFAAQGTARAASAGVPAKVRVKIQSTD